MSVKDETGSKLPLIVLVIAIETALLGNFIWMQTNRIINELKQPCAESER